MKSTATGYQAFRVPGSFRDPAGFVFYDGETLLRQVNHSYRETFDCLVDSGLYSALTEAGLLVRHEEVEPRPLTSGEAYKTLRPEPIPFVSHPFEWCFSQLKAAALCTLAVQQKALNHGMCLKDASAYNIQFRGWKPVFIDTLSFDIYRENRPWQAYRQFCQHFLAPLALMAYSDPRMGQSARVFIDGLPLELASRLLPARSRLSIPILLHIHLHARNQARYASHPHRVEHRRLTRLGLAALLDSLERAIRRMRLTGAAGTWTDYYDDQSLYSPAAAEAKGAIVLDYIERLRPRTLWDLGANDGRFSRLAADRGVMTVAFDADIGAVERNFASCASRAAENLLPLVLDLTNPTPSIGWACEERQSLIERGPADAVMALALVHHLAISNNVPFDAIARFLDKIARAVVIEFVPRSDPNVQRLLSNHGVSGAGYDQERFEAAFQRYYKLADRRPILDTTRTLYLFNR